MNRLLLVVHDPVCGARMRATLESQRDMVVIGVADSAHTTRELLLRGQPDLAVVAPSAEVGGRRLVRALAARVPVALYGDASTLRLARELGLPVAPVEHPLALLGVVRQLVDVPALRRVIGIGASTGGTMAISEVLAVMRPSSPPVLVVQHLPQGFYAGFVSWLQGRTQLQVALAREGEVLQSGQVRVAWGGRHLAVSTVAKKLVCQRPASAPVGRHRPAVDVLFRSLAALGARGVGVLLTGMGEDGARGLLAMRRAGARTIAQDGVSCVVNGMPGAALRLGAASEVLPIGTIGAALRHP